MVNAQTSLDDLLAQAKAAFAVQDYQACVDQCRHLLGRGCADAAVLHLMGGASFRLGRPVFAATAMEAAARITPGDDALLMDLGLAQAQGGKRVAGIRTLTEVLRRRPTDPDLAMRLAPLLRAEGLDEQAVELMERAVAANPQDVGLRCEFACHLTALLRLDEALMHFAVAEHQSPEDSAIQTNIGIVLQARGDAAGAVRRYRIAAARSPGNFLPHLNLSTALLALPDLDQGFAEMEFRPLPPYPWALPPRWRNGPVAHRHLLVLPEQGRGDMIQFSRFVPLAQSILGAKVTLVADPELERLFSGLSVDVCRADGPLPEADLWVPMLSLAHMLKPDLAGLSRPWPYLAPPPGVTFDLPTAAGLKVGLVWAASPSTDPSYTGRSLARRSCPLEHLAPLADLPGVSLFSLQKGGQSGQAKTVPGLESLSDRLEDFADTAAAIAGLDLVISVDTSVAHLAGAMGKPVWLLLAHGQADYRWGSEGESSPWYPQMRLFRAGPAGWAELAGRLAAELALVARGGGRLFPA